MIFAMISVLYLSSFVVWQAVIKPVALFKGRRMQ